MRTALLATSDSRWTDMLSTVEHDFYHLPAYARLSATEAGGDAVGLHVEAEGQAMLLPLIIRELASGERDATSPYGYPGPLLSMRTSPSFLGRALRAGAEALADQGLVSLFVRMHPILCPEAPAGVGTVVHHQPTVVVDLGKDDDEWWAGMRKSHRQQVARALEDGHRVYLDEDFRSFDFFQSAYRRTMERVGAGRSYYFSELYFSGLRSALGDGLKLFVQERDGRAWAAGLFVETNDIVQSHLSADDGSFRRGGAKKLLYAHVRDWARARHDRWLHLGGGTATESGLLKFKAGFSPDRRPFDTLRVILREDEYCDLIRRKTGASGRGDPTAYFPAYREPSSRP